MSLRVAILTVSDRSYRGERPDASGPSLAKEAADLGWQVSKTGLVPDEQIMIQETLAAWCDGGIADVILTTGGTGFAPRDITPEATLAILERLAPGLAEAMRLESLKITPHAMLSRSAAGIRKRTIIINLPGSPQAAMENLRVVAPVLPHAVELLQDNPQAESGHQATTK
jgi:molybdopterin adenylyltransferase